MMHTHAFQIVGLDYKRVAALMSLLCDMEGNGQILPGWTLHRDTPSVTVDFDNEVEATLADLLVLKRGI